MIRFSYRVFTLLFLGLLAANSESAMPYKPVMPDPVLEPWRWQSLPELKGLGLRCATQATDGAMWFGTNEGVRHYDGLIWTEYTPDDGVLGAPVNVLCATSDGRVYAGSDEGISEFKAGAWHRVFPPEGNLPWPIDQIIETSDGKLWAATGWGGLQIKQGKFTLYTSRQMADVLKEKAPYVTLSTLPDEAVPEQAWDDGTGIKVVKGGYLGITRSEAPMPIWALAPNGPGENAGLEVGDIVLEINGAVTNLPDLALDGISGAPVKVLIRRDGEAVERMVAREHLAGSYRGFQVSDVFEDRDGVLWFGISWGGEIISFDARAAKPWTLYTEKDGLVLGDRPRLAQTPDGVIWSINCQSNISVNRFDPSKRENGLAVWTYIPLAKNVGGNDIHTSVLTTQDGTLWVGAHGGTLYRFQNGEWTFHRPPDVPLSRTRVGSLMETVEGALWVVSLGQEASRLDYNTSRWTTYEGLNFQCESPDGSLWFLYQNRVIHYDSQLGSYRDIMAWKEYDLTDGLMDTPFVVYATKKGVIWVGGSHKRTAATARFDGETWVMETHPRLSASIDRRTIFEAADGTVWFAATVGWDGKLGQVGGMLQFDGENWIHHAPPDAPAYAYGVGQTTDGRLWFGGGRLTHFDGQTWTLVTEPAGLKSWVHSILGTQDGGLWVGTRAYGLFHLQGQEWVQYTVEDGLANNTVGIVTPGLDGSIWASTDRGISYFDGRAWTTQALSENLREEVSALSYTSDGARWFQSKRGAIRYEPETTAPQTEMTLVLDEVSQPGNTTLAWTGSDPWRLTPDSELQFSWRLDGGEWSAFSTDKNKVFFSLPDGDHTFEVKARDRDFNEDLTPAVMQFYVIPPVWKQAWFVGLMGILLVAVGVQTGRVVLRDRRLRQSNAELLQDRALERVRAEVTAMGVAEDLGEVVDEMLKELFALGVGFDICVINIIDEDAGVRRQYGPTSLGLSGQAELPLSDVSEDFLEIYRGDQPVVRQVDEALGQRHVETQQQLGRTNDTVWPTEILDAPFAYGTLSLSTKHSKGFGEEDVVLVGEFARVLELGYARFLDFQRLEEQNHALEEANVQILQANKLKSQFLANMSHELRTPLNAILGFSQLMARGDGVTDQQRENLDVIGRSGEHLLALINDVLEMSKIEAGQIALNEERFDLYRLLDGVKEMFGLRAKGKGLALAFERSSDVPQYVQTDEGKLRQVLMNLLSNAIKFTQDGGITLRVNRFDSENTGVILAFEVEDTGVGIASEEMVLLFDAFSQTASGQQSQEGTGLGLPISQEYVQLMGGEITVDSQVGKGSIFRFRIGALPVDETDVKTEQPTQRVVGLAPNQPTYRILIVEDRLESRMLMVNLLGSLGLDVKEAENGQEGVEMWQAWKPHLIWMDMRMPVMDGYEATQKIKEMDADQETVVIALTASAFEEDRKRILDLGCDGFVRKPFREEELFEVMAQHLGVAFVYEEDELVSDQAVLQDDLTSDSLSVLSPEWLAQVHEAASQADEDAIVNLLEEIEANNQGLANGLKKLIDEFQFDKIMALTR